MGPSSHMDKSGQVRPKEVDPRLFLLAYFIGDTYLGRRRQRRARRNIGDGQRLRTAALGDKINNSARAARDIPGMIG